MVSKEIRAGFTLLELLIAMVLTAVVLLMVSNSFSFTSRIWLKAEKEDGTGEIGQLVDLLGEQIGSYYAFDAGKVHNLSIVSGSDTSIAIVTSHSVKSLHGGAPVLARYVFDEATGRLSYYEMPVDWSRTGELIDFVNSRMPAIPESVSYPASSFSLEYFSYDDGESLLKWNGPLNDMQSVVVKWRGAEDEPLKTRILSPRYLDFLS